LYSGASLIDGKKLSKILAYVGSNHDGEALAALHAVRRIIKGDRFHFNLGAPVEADAKKPSTNPHQGPSHLNTSENNPAINKLKAQLAVKSKEITEKNTAISGLNRKIATLEADLLHKTTEAEGWKKRAWKHFWTASSF